MYRPREPQRPEDSEWEVPDKDIFDAAMAYASAEYMGEDATRMDVVLWANVPRETGIGTICLSGRDLTLVAQLRAAISGIAPPEYEEFECETFPKNSLLEDYGLTLHAHKGTRAYRGKLLVELLRRSNPKLRGSLDVTEERDYKAHPNPRRKGTRIISLRADQEFLDSLYEYPQDFPFSASFLLNLYIKGGTRRNAKDPRAQKAPRRARIGAKTVKQLQNGMAGDIIQAADTLSDKMADLAKVKTWCILLLLNMTITFNISTQHHSLGRVAVNRFCNYLDTLATKCTFYTTVKQRRKKIPLRWLTCAAFSKNISIINYTAPHIVYHNMVIIQLSKYYIYLYFQLTLYLNIYSIIQYSINKKVTNVQIVLKILATQISIKPTKYVWISYKMCSCFNRNLVNCAPGTTNGGKTRLSQYFVRPRSMYTCLVLRTRSNFYWRSVAKGMIRLNPPVVSNGPKGLSNNSGPRRLHQSNQPKASITNLYYEKSIVIHYSNGSSRFDLCAYKWRGGIPRR